MTKHKSNLRFFLLTLLVFVGLSAATIGKWSVWHDEGFSAMTIEYGPRQIVMRTAHDVHPPLYYLLLKGWSLVFGDSIVALRSMSLVCMAAAILLTMYLMQRQFGERAARWSAIILVGSPMLLRYSQEARMYGVLALLSVGATYAFLANMKKPVLWRTVVYFLLITAIIYTQYFGILVLVAHKLILLWEVKRSKQPAGLKQWFREAWTAFWHTYRWYSYSVIGMGLAFLPWLPKLRHQFGDVQNGFWIGPVSYRTPFSTLSNIFWLRQEWQLNHWYSVAFICLLVALVWFWRALRNKEGVQNSLRPLIVILLTTPVLLVVLSLPPLNSVFHERYLVSILPLFYGLVGAGWFYYIKANPKSRKVWFATVALLGSLVYGISNAMIWGNNTGWFSKDYFSMKQLSTYVRENRRSDDTIVSSSLWTWYDARYYERHGVTSPEFRLYEPKLQPQPIGNMALMYDRQDLMIHDPNDLEIKNGRVWVFEENQEKIKIPLTWHKTDYGLQKGYAKVTLYTVDKDE